MDHPTEWLPAAVLGALGLVLVAGVGWVARRQAERAGFYWATAGLLLVVDGLVTVFGTHLGVHPIVVADGDGPLVGWLVYRGATVFAERKPNRAALPVAIAATLGWFALNNAGHMDLRMLVGSGSGFAFTLATMRTLYPTARTNLQRIFVKSWLMPLVMIALRPILQSAGVSPNGFVVLWMAPLIGIGLLVILVLLEHHIEEARDLAEQRAEQLRLGALVSGMGTWTFDLTTLNVQWSPELYKLHDLETDTPLGDAQGTFSFVAAEDRERFRTALLEVIRTRGELDLEYRTDSVRGQPRFLHAKARYMARPDGRNLIVGTSVDVTAQRTALDELRIYRTELEALVEQRTSELSASQRKLQHTERLASIGTLTAGLAHQVNNPVGAILAASEFAGRCRGDPDEIEVLRKATQDISEEARRCGEIVRNMLRFASDRETDKKTVPIDEIVMRTLESIRRTSSAREAKFALHAEGPSPLVNVSSIEIEQALMNLFASALQSRDEDLEIRIERRAENESVRILVRDNGCGIPPDDLARVLDPFFTSRLEAGGTGLGLSVAHGIAREHGGDLTLESEVGVGTTAVLSLPTDVSDSTSTPVRPPATTREQA